MIRELKAFLFCTLSTTVSALWLYKGANCVPMQVRGGGNSHYQLHESVALLSIAQKLKITSRILDDSISEKLNAIINSENMADFLQQIHIIANLKHRN